LHKYTQLKVVQLTRVSRVKNNLTFLVNNINI